MIDTLCSQRVEFCPFLDMLNEVGRSPLVSGFFWDDVWNPGCNIHDQVTAQYARVASVASPVPAAIAQASSRELVATVQVGNTCIDMGFNCTAPKVDGLGVRDGRNAPASCDDPRLTQMTVDYQKNMKALREAALNAGKFVSMLQYWMFPMVRLSQGAPVICIAQAWQMLWTGGDEDSIGGGSTAPLGKFPKSIATTIANQAQQLSLWLKRGFIARLLSYQNQLCENAP